MNINPYDPYDPYNQFPITVEPQYIVTRVQKGLSYVYAQTYYEAGDYGIMAFRVHDGLAILGEKHFHNDRIGDFCVFSDSRIAIRSDEQLTVFRYGGAKDFDIVQSIKIKSSLNTGIACNNDFAYVTTGSKIICLDISTGEIAQEFNVTNSFYARSLYASTHYLYVRKCSIDYKTYKLAVYRINYNYKTNPDGHLSLIDEIDSPRFDIDLGRLFVDSYYKYLIEPCDLSNRLITFNGTSLTVVGDLTPFYPALEFIQADGYFIASPDTNLVVLSRSGLTFTEEYRSPVITPYASYRCPGYYTNEFISTRNILGDGIGKNISINKIVS